jgi:4-hydroxy-tetrahydrodipicolinate synthase
METQSGLGGLWLPLVTPVRDGALDEASLRRMIRHYAPQPVDGFILAATTGEGLTLDDDEVERLVLTAAAEIGGRFPICLGLSGSDTRKLIKALDRTARWPVESYLVACPYYTRPSQDGLYQHFAALAGHTDRPILIYNIPYRTGVNMSNETMLRLTALPHIAGVKDCCADAAQSFDLLRMRPATFTVLTGEDPQFHTALSQGADGGILASAHVETARFAEVLRLMRAGDNAAALRVWSDLIDLVRLLFAEPNPAPIKHWLWRAGLIDSPELRLPMTGVSTGLAARIDAEMARRATSVEQAA